MNCREMPDKDLDSPPPAREPESPALTDHRRIVLLSTTLAQNPDKAAAMTGIDQPTAASCPKIPSAHFQLVTLSSTLGPLA